MIVEPNQPTGDFDGPREKADRALFNDISEKYWRKDVSASSRTSRRHRLLQTLSPLPLKPGAIVLEVGCGCGYSADFLTGVYGQYIGVDYAERLIAFARKHNGRPNARFVAADINDYASEEKADLVVMVGVLHHFQDPDRTLKHILGLLKPGGWLAVNEPQSGNRLVQIARKIRMALDKGYSAEQRTFSADQLRRLLEQNDLSSVKIIPQGIFSPPLAEVVLKPDLIFGALGKTAVRADAFLESRLGMRLKNISWNLIGTGQKSR